MKVSTEQVMAIGGRQAKREICAMVADFINQHGAYNKLNSALRIKHFLGQTAVESGYFSRLDENLSYSARRIRQVWPRRFKSVAAAQPYARNPRALANKVYGGRMGNRGKDNAGWEYRGSSIKQITGFSNFAEFTKWIQSKVPGAPDFTKEPDKLRSLEWAVWPAVWYWVERGCWRYADRDAVKALTKRINGGYNGLNLRINATAKAGRVLKMKDLPAPEKKPPKQPDPRLKEYQSKLKTLSLQLNDLALDPGAADGWNGPKTMAATKVFQCRYGLARDGIIGPKTRAAIDHALQTVVDAPAVEVQIDKPVVPESVDQEVKRKTGRWGWLTSIFGGSGVGAATFFGMEWQTVLAIGGISVLVLFMIILMRNQIASAIKTIRTEIEGAV